LAAAAAIRTAERIAACNATSTVDLTGNSDIEVDHPGCERPFRRCPSPKEQETSCATGDFFSTSTDRRQPRAIAIRAGGCWAKIDPNDNFENGVGDRGGYRAWYGFAID
jgi:hypothetical protein